MYWCGILDDRADFVIDDGRICPDKDYYRNIVAWADSTAIDAWKNSLAGGPLHVSYAECSAKY